jgi:hypothetical protein
MTKRSNTDVETVVEAPVPETPQPVAEFVRHVTIKSPEIHYVKSRFAHRQAIRQWKLSRTLLNRR